LNPPAIAIGGPIRNKEFSVPFNDGEDLSVSVEEY